MTQNHKIVVAQIGARMHYAVPSIIEDAGMLDHFYTDAYAGKGVLGPILSVLPSHLRPSFVKRFMDRKSSIPNDKITSFNALQVQYYLKSRKVFSGEDRIGLDVWMAREYNKRVVNFITDKTEALYGFLTASTEIFEKAKSVGAVCILDQFSASNEFQSELMREELSLWPGWEKPTYQGKNYQAVMERIYRERELTDVATCLSSFVKSTVMDKFPKTTKFYVIPGGYNCPAAFGEKKVNRDNPLRVLFVGGVHLQKGIQYLLKAAQKLGKAVEVRLVGGISCNKEKLSEMLGENIVVIGHISRQEVGSQYAWADVLCFPSLSDSFGLVTLEAMSRGVPVIATVNVGSAELISEGKDGFVVPIRDSDAIAEKLMFLNDNRDVVEQMSRQARLCAEKHQLDRYARDLIAALEECL